MNNCFKYFSVAIFSLICVIACDKDSDDSDISMVDIPAIEAAVISGEWKITYFLDSNQDETSDFNGYTFDFNTGSVLQVTNGTTSISGVWTITHDADSSSSDDESDDVDFNIILNSSTFLEELSEDWSIKSYSNSKIELVHVSGGDGDVDYLTLEKI